MKRIDLYITDFEFGHPIFHDIINSLLSEINPCIRNIVGNNVINLYPYENDFCYFINAKVDQSFILIIRFHKHIGFAPFKGIIDVSITNVFNFIRNKILEAYKEHYS